VIWLQLLREQARESTLARRLSCGVWLAEVARRRTRCSDRHRQAACRARQKGLPMLIHR
jgi:hypothetical protein